MRAKVEEQAEARRLRAEGRSLREISRALGVSLSSASIWVRDVRLPLPEVVELPVVEPAVDPDEPLRPCGRCHQDLPESRFNRGQGYCRACFQQYHRDNPRNKARTNELKRERVEAARQLVAAHLAAAACEDCGLADPVVLEFDHVADKRCDIASLVNRGPKAESLLREIAQCEVVCANCHRCRTAARGGWRRLDFLDAPRWRSPLQELSVLHAYCVLMTSGCVDCREANLVVLDFDHVGTKTANVMDLARRERAFSRVLAEIAQCVVRCANCHRRRTAATRGWYRTRAA